MTTFFGTDGIRGRVGEVLFNQENLFSLGQAIALWAQEKYNSNPHILLIHDTRISSFYIKAALKSGLLMHTSTLYDGGVLPTPAAFHIMKTIPTFHCALIISASHNPYYDNGIKLFDRMGKLSQYDEERISELITQKKPLTYSQFGEDIYYHTQAYSFYCNQIVSLFPPQLLQNKKIIIDLAHGATYKCAETIFNTLGATTVFLHNQPNGTNINQECGTLYPQRLQRAVIEYKADIGFAFDGDGDRVIAIDKNGILKDGDDILSLLIHHPTYQKESIIVGTVMSNFALEKYFKENNKSFLRTSVGDKYITQTLKEKSLLLGGEQSGHIICNDIIATGDGILAALKVIETLLYLNKWDFETFIKYPQILINVPIKYKKDLSTPLFQNLIQKAEKKLLGGRLLIRYSGTESLLRIMAETSSHNLAQSICASIAYHLKFLLDTP